MEHQLAQDGWPPSYSIEFEDGWVSPHAAHAVKNHDPNPRRSNGSSSVLLQEARFLGLLCLHQFVMEWGDNYWEQWAIFRHRYFFEGFYAAILAFCMLSPFEYSIVATDVLTCLGYRVANTVLCLLGSQLQRQKSA